MGELDLDDKLDKRIEQRMNSRNTEWYYIQGSENKNGKMKGFLIGPFSYDKAQSLMSSKKFSSAEMIALNTTDLSRAGQILKYRRFHNGEGITSVMDRVKHKGVVDESI
jgi:hypothetical protein